MLNLDDVNFEEWDEEEIENFLFVVNKKQIYQRDKYIYIMMNSVYFSKYNISSKRKLDIREVNNNEIRYLKNNYLKVRIFEEHRWNTYTYNELINKYHYLKKY